MNYIKYIHRQTVYPLYLHCQDNCCALWSFLMHTPESPLIDVLYSVYIISFMKICWQILWFTPIASFRYVLIDQLDDTLNTLLHIYMVLPDLFPLYPYRKVFEQSPAMTFISVWISGPTRHPSTWSTRSVSSGRWRRRGRRGILHHITDSHFVWFILHIYCICQDNMVYIVIYSSNINYISYKIYLDM